jgi:hypothetical protein
VLENLELHESNDSRIIQLNSTVATRKNVYRKASTGSGLTGAGLALTASPFVYFLLEPLLFISAILMFIGSILVWTRSTIIGASLILVGGFFGGFLGLPSLLWRLLAAAFGNWVYRLPLLPLGVIIPIASSILAFMSREPSKSRPVNRPIEL